MTFLQYSCNNFVTKFRKSLLTNFNRVYTLYIIYIAGTPRMTFPLYSVCNPRLEGSLDLLDCVGLDNVTDLDIVVALDVETTVVTHMYLLDIILESLE